MKRLIVLYEFPFGDSFHQTIFFPIPKRFIVEIVRYHLNLRMLLPAFSPVLKNQQ